jgi:hypothetical protein
VKITFQDGLLFGAAIVEFRGKHITLENVLIDTGSGGTVFSADKLLSVGIQLEPEDFVHRIRGVGGTEFVFTKRIDRLSLGELVLNNFEIEVGAMDYGFNLDGIIGTDFLYRVGAVIDLANLELSVNSIKR